MSSTTSANSSQSGMSLSNWSLLIFLALIWGGSFFLNGVIVKHIPVLSIVFFRVFFAAIFLLLFMKFTKTSIPLNRPLIVSFLIMGLINNFIPFSLIVGGQAYIGSGLASVLNATTPLFAAIVAHISTDDPAERLGPKRIVGILFGIIGVSVLLGPKIGEVGFSGNEVFGQIAVLAAAVSYGVAVVYGRRFGKQGISPVAAATGQVSASSFLMLPVVLIVDKPWTYLASVELSTIASMLCLSILCTAYAYILYFKLIR
ncbi:MAG: DMT family transporter, partial [Sneathiella sp.]|nr:DMT family transporter [Sneathiella sp.]